MIPGLTLKDLGYADGMYTSYCRDCGNKFKGDKRATRCFKCALAAQELAHYCTQCNETIVFNGDRCDDCENSLRRKIEVLRHQFNVFMPDVVDADVRVLLDNLDSRLCVLEDKILDEET